MKEQQSNLNEELRGHGAYYRVTGNGRTACSRSCGGRWPSGADMARAAQRGSPPGWEQFDGLLRVFPLIPARIVHSVL